MFRQIVVGCGIVAVSAACGESTPPEQPPPLPQATEDQVGLPQNYTTQFTPFYVFDRPPLNPGSAAQVRVVYANAAAVAGLPPFALGSILVMETWPTKKDAQGMPLVGTDGRYVRDTLSGIFVMRKEKWFGRRYGESQTGEWEYASYRPNKSANVVGDAAAQACAVCHLDAGLSRDWVYRANIHLDPSLGAIPTPPAGQPADQPFINSYTFVPGTTTVKVGTRITWTNRDQVKHTVTANDGSFSGLVPQGATFPHTFSVAGTFQYFCAVHPAMKGTVVVEP